MSQQEAQKSTTNEDESTAHHLPAQKLTAFARLKSFAGSVTAKKEKPPPVVFPPPSWELDDSKDNGAGASNWDTLLLNQQYHDDKSLRPEPLTFAQKIKGLIQSLPIPGTGTDTLNTAHEPTGPEDGKSGSPVPPGVDQELLRMLSSEDVMNGDRDKKNKEGYSVWSVLSGMGEGVKERFQPTRMEEEKDGVMMYAPLQPSNSSELELAESETMLEYVNEEPESTPVEKGKQSQGESSAPVPEPPKPIVEKRVWVPSTTQLSLLTTWWGYRLYLPPPVMAILDSSSLKATARAAMITSALKWLLAKVPLMLVPPQLRGAVAVLKRLTPVVGYVGIFIAWSWGRVQACDKGNGVVLTATWLLPVAVVPMAWDAGDIYGPPPPPKREISQGSSGTKNAKKK